MEIKEKPQFCYFCGHKLSEGDRFCDQCGKEVAEEHADRQHRINFKNIDVKELLNRANHLAEPLVPKRLAARFPMVMPAGFIAVYAAIFVIVIIAFSSVLGSGSDLSDTYYEDGYDDYSGNEDYDEDYDSGYDEDYDSDYDEDYSDEEVYDDESKGLILMTIDCSGSLEVVSIDPETNNQNVLSSIHLEPQTNDEVLYAFGGGGSFYSNYKHWISSDYKYIASTKTLRKNNERHAGWFDESGEFFDVIEELV